MWHTSHMSPIEKDHARGWNAAVVAQLRAERAAAGLTVKELADKSGVPNRTLVRLINAQRAIDIAHLASLSEALELTITEFLSRARARLILSEPLPPGDVIPPANVVTLDTTKRAKPADD